MHQAKFAPFHKFTIFHCSVSRMHQAKIAPFWKCTIFHCSISHMQAEIAPFHPSIPFSAQDLTQATRKNIFPRNTGFFCWITDKHLVSIAQIRNLQNSNVANQTFSFQFRNFSFWPFSIFSFSILRQHCSIQKFTTFHCSIFNGIKSALLRFANFRILNFQNASFRGELTVAVCANFTNWRILCNFAQFFFNFKFWHTTVNDTKIMKKFKFLPPENWKRFFWNQTVFLLSTNIPMEPIRTENLCRFDPRNIFEVPMPFGFHWNGIAIFTIFFGSGPIAIPTPASWLLCSSKTLKKADVVFYKCIDLADTRASNYFCDFARLFGG